MSEQQKKQPARAGKKAPTGSMPAIRPKVVMAAMRELVRRMLQGAGYRVLDAPDGEQALALPLVALPPLADVAAKPLDLDSDVLLERVVGRVDQADADITPTHCRPRFPGPCHMRCPHSSCIRYCGSGHSSPRR